MRMVTPMIGYKEGNYYMKEVFCIECGSKKVIPLKNRPPRCLHCKRTMSIRWKLIGNEVDYKDYYSKKSARRMRRGKEDLV